MFIFCNNLGWNLMVLTTNLHSKLFVGAVWHPSTKQHGRFSQEAFIRNKKQICCLLLDYMKIRGYWLKVWFAKPLFSFFIYNNSFFGKPPTTCIEKMTNWQGNFPLVDLQLIYFTNLISVLFVSISNWILPGYINIKFDMDKKSNSTIKFKNQFRELEN